MQSPPADGDGGDELGFASRKRLKVQHQSAAAGSGPTSSGSPPRLNVNTTGEGVQQDGIHRAARPASVAPRPMSATSARPGSATSRGRPGSSSSAVAAAVALGRAKMEGGGVLQNSGIYEVGMVQRQFLAKRKGFALGAGEEAGAHAAGATSGTESDGTMGGMGGHGIFAKTGGAPPSPAATGAAGGQDQRSAPQKLTVRERKQYLRAALMECRRDTNELAANLRKVDARMKNQRRVLQKRGKSIELMCKHLAPALGGGPADEDPDANTGRAHKGPVPLREDVLQSFQQNTTNQLPLNRRKCKTLENVLGSKDAEIRSLKNQPLFTHIVELEAAVRSYNDEVRRLQVLATGAGEISDPSQVAGDGMSGPLVAERTVLQGALRGIASSIVDEGKMAAAAGENTSQNDANTGGSLLDSTRVRHRQERKTTLLAEASTQEAELSQLEEEYEAVLRDFKSKESKLEERYKHVKEVYNRFRELLADVTHKENLRVEYRSIKSQIASFEGVPSAEWAERESHLTVSSPNKHLLQHQVSMGVGAAMHMHGSSSAHGSHHH